jgi:hypothetical protein
VSHFKPEDSAALEAAEHAAAAKTFLTYARFPLASMGRGDEGYQFTLRDVRFATGDRGADNVFVQIEVTADLRVTQQEFRYATSRER